ncbi:hypothetical protein HA402_007123 [Bradysia odoriphaga]|nr:hypothetical protein HA402_007123 [Bradysia odoriphaga]
MILLKLLHLTLIVWCSVIYDKATVEATLDKDLVNGLVLEASELENNFFELQKSANVTALYQSLIDKIERVRGTRDNDRALVHLVATLRYQLADKDVKDPNLIFDVESYADLVISSIELRNRETPEINICGHTDLTNKLNQLRRIAKGNFALNEYRRFVEGFQLTYFPYAVCYLESLQIPTTPTAYDNLDDITSTISEHLNDTKRFIEEIKLNVRDVTFSEEHKPEDALYIWKNADIRDKISRLFKGEAITLVADVKTATKQHNALKFNKVDLVFRSSNQTVHNELGNVIREYLIFLRHSGQSAFRYNNHFYHVESAPLQMSFTFEKTDRGDPVNRNFVYNKISGNRPVLSPFTDWKLLLIDLTNSVHFETLMPFERLEFDIELHGSGSYVEDDMVLCKEEKLSTFYTQI